MRDRPRSADRKIIGVPKKQAAGTAQFCRRFAAELSGDVSEIERWVEGLRLTASSPATFGKHRLRPL